MQTYDKLQGVDKGWRILVFIWIAMLISLAIYLLVAQMIRKQSGVLVGDDFPLATVRAILYGMSVISLSTIGYFRRYVLGSNKFNEKNAPRITHNQHPLLGRYSTAVITSMALSESIGIYGLVLFLLGSDISDLYILLTISALAMYHYRPKRDEFEALLKSHSSEMQPNKTL